MRSRIKEVIKRLGQLEIVSGLNVTERMDSGMDVGRVNKVGRYRKIDPRIWNDKKFRALTDRGKLVFLFILTHPSMTAIGAMRATLSGLASELQWDVEDFRKAFLEASSAGMLEADEQASYIAAPNFVKFNFPESPNVIKAWRSCLQFIPECELLNQLIKRVKGFIHAFTPSFIKVFDEAFTEGFPEAFDQPSPNQEHEHEQEQEQQQHQPLIERGNHTLGPDVVASLRSELQIAGIKGSNLDQCMKVAGLTPLGVLLVAEEAGKKANENPAGWIFKKLTSGCMLPRTVPSKEICRLARAGRIRSVRGVAVNGHIGHTTDGSLLIGEAGPKQHRIPATDLRPESIELTRRNSQ